MTKIFFNQNNNNLTHNYIVEEGKNNNGYYRKWNNGEAEMWGTSSVASNGLCTVQLPVPFMDVSYQPFSTPLYNAENANAVTVSTVQNESKTQFYIYAREIDGSIPATGTKYNWFVRGKWK